MCRSFISVAATVTSQLGEAVTTGAVMWSPTRASRISPSSAATDKTGLFIRLRTCTARPPRRVRRARAPRTGTLDGTLPPRPQGGIQRIRAWNPTNHPADARWPVQPGQRMVAASAIAAPDWLAEMRLRSRQPLHDRGGLVVDAGARV